MFEKHLTIENANSSGQGYCSYHSENPHHKTLEKLGWKYSHTTPITRVDGSKTAIHTYRFPNTNNVVGVWCDKGWRAEAGKLGDSRRYSYFGGQLEKYLKRKTRKLLLTKP